MGQDVDVARPSRRHCKHLAYLLLGAAAVVSLILLDWFLDIRSKMLGLVASSVAFFRTRTPLACASYVGVYLGANLLSVPLTPFEITTGFIFGFRLGIFLDTVGRTSGALLCFQMARLLSRSKMKCPCMTGNKVMKGIGSAVEEQGLRFLILFNLAVMPVAIKNYGLGFVPEVSTFKFVAAIFIVEIPMASIWAFIGSAAAQELENDGISLTNVTEVHNVISGASKVSPLKLCILAVGVVTLLILVHFVGKKVSVELDRAGDASSEELENELVDELAPTGALCAPSSSQGGIHQAVKAQRSSTGSVWTQSRTDELAQDLVESCALAQDHLP